MNQLLYLLVVLACPLMMIFMMRGMHGGHGRSEHEQRSASTVVDTTARDARIGELEREVARLRDERAACETPDPTFVDELRARLDRQLVGPRR